MSVRRIIIISLSSSVSAFIPYALDKGRKFSSSSSIRSRNLFCSFFDLLIISFAEHNSTYTTAFKNIFDWISRIKDRKHFGEKPVFVLATAPGPGGAGGGPGGAAQKR